MRQEEGYNEHPSALAMPAMQSVNFVASMCCKMSVCAGTDWPQQQPFSRNRAIAALQMALNMQARCASTHS